LFSGCLLFADSFYILANNFLFVNKKDDDLIGM
jgi:hypothetical protein